jgi:hypothetical protein
MAHGADKSGREGVAPPVTCREAAAPPHADTTVTATRYEQLPTGPPVQPVGFRENGSRARDDPLCIGQSRPLGAPWTAHAEETAPARLTRRRRRNVP